MEDHLVHDAASTSSDSSYFKVAQWLNKPAPTEDPMVYLGETTNKLPSCTSKWTNECLASLGIHYYKEFHSSPHDILDMIYEKTNCFGPLQQNEKINCVEALQSKLTFSYSIEDLCQLLGDRAPPLKRSKQEKGNVAGECSFVKDLPDLLTVLNEDISRLINVEGNESELTGSNEEDFLLGIRDAITLEVAYDLNEKNRIDQGSAPEELYSDIFKAFTKLCKVAHHPGSVWIAKRDIQNKIVTSKAGLLLYPWENSSQRYMTESIDVVSVVKLKKGSVMKKGVSKEKRLTRNTLSQYGDGAAEDKTLEQKPEIGHYLDSRLLGQHGGELLCHYSFYTPQLETPRMKYMPGMIVVGTQVFFTLLEIKGSHFRALMSNRIQDTTSDRATIYYSEPKNFLKKEDRDTLIKAICRLNNI